MTRIMGTAKLKELNRLAVERQYNQAVSDEGLAHLDPGGVHVIAFAMPHGGGDHLRTQVLAKVRNRGEPMRLLLDIGYDEYEQLTKV
jgi:hypothetical protein